MKDGPMKFRFLAALLLAAVIGVLYVVFAGPSASNPTSSSNGPGAGDPYRQYRLDPR